MLVEVVYTEIEKQIKIPLNVHIGCTIEEALCLSGISEIINISGLSVGVFGEIKPPNHVLSENDRVEIYRPLKIDPKDARRKRV